MSYRINEPTKTYMKRYNKGNLGEVYMTLNMINILYK